MTLTAIVPSGALITCGYDDLIMGIQRIETKSGIRYRVRRTVNQINRSKVVSTEAEAREIDSRWAAEIQPARKVKPKELMAAFLCRRWVEQNPFLYFELEEAR